MSRDQQGGHSEHAHTVMGRRSMLIISGAAIVPLGPKAGLAAPPPGVPTTAPRVPGIGGGFDMVAPPALASQDVIYPGSVEGLWQCSRAVVSVEGDVGQAQIAWRVLGGSEEAFGKKKTETFTTRFILPPASTPNVYEFDGKSVAGVVLDRGFEISQRVQGATNIVWDASVPGDLAYESASGGTTSLSVVQRSAELPNDKGFGLNELVRVTSAAGGVFGASKVVRAVRVQRRFRRALGDDGARVIEGLEIVKTYRVLDGVAGTEFPTSTTKSQLRLVRPPPPPSSGLKIMREAMKESLQ